MSLDDLTALRDGKSMDSWYQQEEDRISARMDEDMSKSEDMPEDWEHYLAEMIEKLRATGRYKEQYLGAIHLAIQWILRGSASRNRVNPGT
jgi:hypothetical protein